MNANGDRVDALGILRGSLTITMLPTPLLRDLLGSVSAELRLRGQADAANYVAKAVAVIE